MATDTALTTFKEAIARYRGLYIEKVVRRNLGEESIEAQLEPKLSEINEKVLLVTEYATNVTDGVLNTISNYINSISDLCDEFARRSNGEYLANKGTFIGNIEANLEAIRTHWYYVICAGIEKNGLLKSANIQNEFEMLKEELSSEAARLSESIRIESEIAINNAKELSVEIESKARRTATKISVEAAQKQFNSLLDPLANQIKIWAVLSGILVFIIVCLLALFSEDYPDKLTAWQLLHKTTIHIAIIGFFGTLAAYCMRLLKSSIHMYNHKKHRCILANSIEAFVESTSTTEQRDLVLMHLINAISDFGTTGLVEKSNEPTNFSIGNISPNLSSLSK